MHSTHLLILHTYNTYTFIDFTYLHTYLLILHTYIHSTHPNGHGSSHFYVDFSFLSQQQVSNRPLTV